MGPLILMAVMFISDPGALISTLKMLLLLCVLVVINFVAVPMELSPSLKIWQESLGLS